MLDDLVFDRAAGPTDGLVDRDVDHGVDHNVDPGPGGTCVNPQRPTECLIYLKDAQSAPPTKALMGIIADLAGFDMPEMRQEVLGPQDWEALTQNNLPPVEVGGFYLRGSHSPAAPEGQVDLCIDAGLAFGTGHHETTRGCLALFAQVMEARAPTRVLDMGCGSGVLAMAAAKVSDAQIVGIEMDADSLEVAVTNAALNGVADRLRLILGDRPDLGGGGYDLIFANILAGPLIALAPGFTQVACQGADLLLAGFLTEQESDMLTAYHDQGWTRVGGFHDGQWALLWLKKS